MSAPKIDQRYLIGEGFKKDTTCPLSVNRWEKSDGETHFTSSYWVSITLTEDGSRTLYGVANFHSGDGNGYITEHRFFDGVELSIDDFKKFIDRCCLHLPDYIKSTNK